MTLRARFGWTLIAIAGFATVAAPMLASHRAGEQLADRGYAPPTYVHIWDHGVHAPFIRPMTMTDRLRREYREDESSRVALPGTADQPMLLLGADPLGRDVFSRLVLGARWSLGVTICGAFGALVFGAAIGGFAGISGGRTDRWLMRLADFVLVLPAVYLVLVLRAMLPLVLTTGDVFLLMSALFAVAAWPHVARGVRAIVIVERSREYVEAVRAAGEVHPQVQCIAVSVEGQRAHCGERMPHPQRISAKPIDAPLENRRQHRSRRLCPSGSFHA